MSGALLLHVSLLARPWFIVAKRPIDQYVHTRSRPDRQPYIRFDRVGPSYQGGKEALPCVRRYSWWVPTVRGRIIFFARNMDALPCVRRCSWWVPAVRGETFFSQNTMACPLGPCCQMAE